MSLFHHPAPLVLDVLFKADIRSKKITGLFVVGTHRTLTR